MIHSKDLMIGDWVRITDDDTDEFHIVQVAAISSTGNIYASIEPDSPIYPFAEDCVDPITLTSEILEKNGFKNISVVTIGTPKNRWVSDDTRTEITIWMDDTLPMEIVKNVYYEDEVAYTLPFPGTVSQLQHVLRLCGISKEIVL